MSSDLTRRALLGGAISVAACSRKPRASMSSDRSVASSSATLSSAQIPRRPLGRTGASVSMVGIGGYHLGQAAPGEGERIVRSAIDRGVTFLDNSWDYHGGKSEEIMGRALQDGYRQRAFLMTKVDGRTKQAAAGQLEQSLRRLRSDFIDLVQIHEVIRFDDPTRVFAEGGAIEALMEARNAGKIRFIGFTGHKDPKIHLAMLAEADRHGFRFDTVQMPLNVLDAHYRSFERAVLPVAVSKGMGVLGMKSMGAGEILKSGVVTAVECLQYAMNLPTSVVITGCDSLPILDQAIHAAQTFSPLTQEEVARLLARTRDSAEDGKLEPFKTSDKHDSTAKNPKWLDSAQM